MKRTLSLLTLFGLLLIVSCFEPPQYSIIPRIVYESYRTVEVPGASTEDSLFVTVSFRDGDGDLGRSGTENAPPFNQKWYFLLNPIPTCESTVIPPCKKSSFVDVDDLSNVVKYSTRRTNPDYDTLPPYVKPFRCDNYEIMRDETTNQIVDTVYIQRNPRTFTFFCDLYTKEPGPSGPVFVKYDWYVGSDCPLPGGGFYGRFDILGKDNDPDLGLPVEGTLTFRVVSNSLFATFKNKTIKLKIRIVDRAGHYSNEVETREFTLD